MTVTRGKVQKAACCNGSRAVDDEQPFAQSQKGSETEVGVSMTRLALRLPEPTQLGEIGSQRVLVRRTYPEGPPVSRAVFCRICSRELSLPNAGHADDGDGAMSRQRRLDLGEVLVTPGKPRRHRRSDGRQQHIVPEEARGLKR